MIFNDNSVQILCVISNSTTEFELDLISKQFNDFNVKMTFISNFSTDVIHTIDTLIKSIHGVVCFGGEEDISPDLYGEIDSGVHTTNRFRDEFELTLFDKVLKNNLPYLGICRGMQLMNIALGGTLFQDIQENTIIHTGDWQKYCNSGFQLKHNVKVVQNTKLYNILSNHNIRVNSYHHQAIKKVGLGLLVNAYSDDGIIEGIEHYSKPLMGIQWHPELMKEDFNKAIFNYFIKKSIETKNH
ncbi:MAG: gamma-glutamyl-gamma-aminobutyrate hydrolase family protein [Faecalibacterium sp.]|nr:gamma-glutamyl-gamma-aminobutyrate hydrolase family protein [Ruminococcus flavefaciens]MCM1391697.1 gamma-glutamyl-gamma-aminobutyrate hydrolase family protein [Ruminococcus sp.]MCM1484649.1 gamma-glutamyl-gamma-aminobutyrate hydrolase family protein [Faecalibacterium sp.]